jgi:hydrogenase maturation factor
VCLAIPGKIVELDPQCADRAVIDVVGVRARMCKLAQAPFTVPLLVEDGKVIQVGWQGRGCVVAGR